MPYFAMGANPVAAERLAFDAPFRTASSIALSGNPPASGKLPVRGLPHTQPAGSLPPVGIPHSSRVPRRRATQGGTALANTVRCCHKQSLLADFVCLQPQGSNTLAIIAWQGWLLR